MSRHAIAELARQILERKIEPQLGCREIATLRHELAREEQDDPKLLAIVGIDSELDEFPIGSARALWDATALAAADARRDERLAHYQSLLLNACRALAAWR